MENKALSRQSNVPRAPDDTLEDSLYPRAGAEFCLGSRYPRRGPKHVLQNLVAGPEKIFANTLSRQRHLSVSVKTFLSLLINIVVKTCKVFELTPRHRKSLLGT